MRAGVLYNSMLTYCDDHNFRFRLYKSVSDSEEDLSLATVLSTEVGGSLGVDTPGGFCAWTGVGLASAIISR